MTKQQETRIAARVIAQQIVQNAKAPSVDAIMHRISSLTAAAKVHANPAAYGYALQQIDQAAADYWKAGRKEARAALYRITSLTQAAAKRGPESFAYALDQIDAAARTYWKQARA